MAERLAEDLWRLDIPLVGNPLKNLNSYLLTGERSLLIDTCVSASWRSMASRQDCWRKPVSISRLRSPVSK